MCNFADDNSFSVITKIRAELKNTLQFESEVLINWFKNNKMIANPKKFQAIILDCSNEIIEYDNKTIQTVPSVRFLGVQLADKLNFNLHVSNTCKSDEDQISALIRLNNFYVLKENEF